MIPTELHKTPAETVISSQKFDKCILQKLPRKTKKMTKMREKTFSDLEQECPTQLQDFFFWIVFVENNFI